MDLNDLYFRHQICLMRANGARNDRSRGGHRDHSDDLARHIGHWQRRVGAAARAAWIPLARSGVSEDVLC